MSVIYDFDTPSHVLRHYYQYQTGGNLPVFRGATRQRGYGLGGIFSKMFQGIVPVLKNVAKTAGKQLVKTGANIVTDVIDGKNVKNTALDNLSRGGQELLSTLTSNLTGTKRGGVKRKKPTQFKGKSVKRRRRNITSDIFK